MKYVMDMIERLQNQCAICWCFQRTEDVYHDAEDCPSVEFFLEDVGHWKKKNMYGRDSACFGCSVPGDICRSYGEGSRCVKKEVVIPVCLMVFTLNHQVGMKIVNELADREFMDAKDYSRWLVQGRRVCGFNSTNAFALFDSLCRELRWAIYKFNLIEKQGGCDRRSQNHCFIAVGSACVSY
jgi:hypothetical protein